VNTIIATGGFVEFLAIFFKLALNPEDISAWGVTDPNNKFLGLYNIAFTPTTTGTPEESTPEGKLAEGGP
jgi:hypothetical protein